MSLPVKIIISIVIAIVVASATTYLQGNTLPDLVLTAAFCVATVATVLLTGLTSAQSSGSLRTERKQAPARNSAPTSAAASGPREEGNVKWFNVSKGFGFITLDNDEEIFVHFRSIRGEGRRSLRDGQRVSFVVADSDKGPQAEDVEALD
jgi:CspA family cold shock protein